MEWGTMTKKNPANPKEQFDSIIERMDTRQLTHSSNRISVTKELENSLSTFIKSRGTNLSLNEEFVKHDANPLLLNENIRFSRGIKEVKIERA